MEKYLSLLKSKSYVDAHIFIFGGEIKDRLDFFNQIIKTVGDDNSFFLLAQPTENIFSGNATTWAQLLQTVKPARLSIGSRVSEGPYLVATKEKPLQMLGAEVSASTFEPFYQCQRTGFQLILTIDSQQLPVSFLKTVTESIKTNLFSQGVEKTFEELATELTTHKTIIFLMSSESSWAAFLCYFSAGQFNLKEL